ncbi:NAD(P)/FAD-dependent oxidoreductase [Streptomyces sp. NPDC059785]|uniref:NAD(P)/FAD-dependent oxidoreductase n=1 Tax=Streptomyces sp. NPDC059785 TaxID=3346945 RepID=UPI003652BEA8
MSSVVVVGAGIVGASVAYRLARRGVLVTLLDQGPAPAAGVTGDSFAWIGDSGGDWPGGALDLRSSVRADYRRLESELPGVTVRWTGSLDWNRTQRPDAELGPGQYWVSRDGMALLEPRLRNPPERAVHIPGDGGVDPVAVTAALVDGARAHGAEVVFGAAVASLHRAGGRLRGVRSSLGLHPAATVVLACGTGAAALCEPLGVRLPVAVSPAWLVRLAAPSGLVRGVVATPRAEVREARDGELRVTLPAVGDWSAASAERAAGYARERVAELFTGGAECRVLSCRAGRRPMPEGGPLVGPVTPDGSVHVAVAHSAVTLGPTVGRLVADELADGRPAGELRRCRPR